MTVHELRASLDSPLPKELAVGAGSALFVSGTCYCPSARIRSLTLLVDGLAQPLDAHGMPRLDFFAALHPQLDPFDSAAVQRDPHSPEDPLLLAYASGFWGIATVTQERPEHELALRAELEGGGSADAELARITQRREERMPEAPRWPGPAGEAKVAICMATYNPPAQLLRRQLSSIREQSHGNWMCLISDDRSSDEAFGLLEREVGGDPRFAVSRSPHRHGFFGNFERALSMVPQDAEYVAMADQDDCWYPDKLQTLLARIGAAQLVYSDARIVGRDGGLIADSYWIRRQNNHSDLLSLLVANSVTGAASLMRREVLDYALPFPPAQFGHFHDHWIALTALCLGEIAFVDRPLYDYVQHGGASLGHATATRMTGLLERLSHPRAPRERIRTWRLHYFVDVCRLLALATMLELRCGPRLSRDKRRVLERFLRTGSSPAEILALAGRGLREMVGRPETLGAEWMVAHAFLWRRLVAASARERPQRRLRLDAVPPPSLALKPARVGPQGAAHEVAQKIAPLELAISEDAPIRINLLIPTVDLEHFFGGYITKLNLAKRLAARGMRVRLVTTDPVGALAPGWRRTIESYSGLDGLFDSVEVEFGRAPSPLEVSSGDGFIATSWWTGHIAAAAVRSLDPDGRFVYLIQEYEPFTFPMGSYAALAEQSYRFEHFALFSSELLRDYFRRHAVGVYRAGVAAGDTDSLAFENAITPVEPPSVAELATRGVRRLLFYARPEPHAARNMFELGVLALSTAVQEGLFQRDWELRGIGTVSGRRSIPLGDASLSLLPRSEQSAYGELLREHDVGLALMYTPHPSLVPIEMASAGMLAVTNSFENKTAEAMSAISPNIITAEPSVEAIVAALAQATARVDDHAGRARGSRVSWSRDWHQTFDDELLERVSAVLRGLAPAA